MNTDKLERKNGEITTEPDANQNAYEIPRAHETDVYAITFGPGAFDTMVQLGVIHALLVARRRPPNVVLGLSAGAINAVALGEVFAEPGGLHGQVSRFREILNAARDSLRVLRHELSPDPLELNTEHALAPMELPIHHRKERDERIGALRAVVGILRLFNDITKLRITLHVLVQAGQRYLRLKEACASRSRIQRWKRVPPALVRCLLFLGCYSWRLAFPLLRAYRRVTLLPPDNPQKHWRIAPVNHFLSIWRRIKTLAPIKAIKVLLFMSALSFTIYLLVRLLPDSLWPWNWILSAVGIPITINITMAFIVYSKWHLLLKAYDLHDQLFHPYVLKQFLISTFHPNYYGKFIHASAAECALAESDTALSHQEAPPKTFADYLSPTSGAQGIRIVAVGTSLKNGKSIGFPKDTKIIDGMMASMAFPPFLKAYEVDGELYIDPACIDEEPIAPLMDYLRHHMNPSTTAAHVFHITPFPASRSSASDSFTSISTIARRSLELLQSRRATIEQELTQQYSSLLPKGSAIHLVQSYKFVAANLFPIETEAPLHITEQFLTTSSNEDRERIVLHAIATGCRITLQRILAPEIEGLKKFNNLATINCRDLLTTLGLAAPVFPGSDSQSGPGLYEICNHCTLHSHDDLKNLSSNDKQILARQGPSTDQPIWPKKQDENVQSNSSSEQRSIPHETPPAKRKSESVKNNTPWVSTVWSGGVFRGVFQIGAIAAYNETGVKPRVFAGASVGSIMAAMAARVTSLDKKSGRLEVQKAAATFIGLDRFVLTDRFADLVRRLTIRANDIHVTPQMLDDTLRQFERLDSNEFNNTVREVAAGFERLLYISPFELLDLYRALHNADGKALGTLVANAIDYIFERSGAGLELLGAEPLKMLIREHVLGDTFEPRISLGSFTSKLGSSKPYLLISATDLTDGKLHIIGDPSNNRNGDPLLIEALLAGSAFPTVFRPRRFSEVYPAGHHPSVFVDGGIMDNLPLSPVVKFLENQANAGQIKERPSVPHLILSASLECRVADIQKSEELESFQNDWRALNRRVTELKYNRKVTAFTNAQRHFQAIYNANPMTALRSPLNLEVATTKPEWLCGTFGFHPMLGFSQEKQAKSIAHGCAMTMATLAQLSGKYGNESWGITMGTIEEEAFAEIPPIAMVKEDPLSRSTPGDRVVNVSFLKSLPRKKRAEKGRTGLCWFRDEICPFSATGIEETGNAFAKETKTALIMIYNLCGQASTHSRQNN
ncbi:MAG: patatin-like phospholipase family protein [Nitrospira sp.]